MESSILPDIILHEVHIKPEMDDETEPDIEVEKEIDTFQSIERSCGNLYERVTKLSMEKDNEMQSLRDQIRDKQCVEMEAEFLREHVNDLTEQVSAKDRQIEILTEKVLFMEEKEQADEAVMDNERRRHLREFGKQQMQLDKLKKKLADKDKSLKEMRKLWQAFKNNGEELFNEGKPPLKRSRLSMNY